MVRKIGIRKIGIRKLVSEKLVSENWYPKQWYPKIGIRKIGIRKLVSEKLVSEKLDTIGIHTIGVHTIGVHTIGIHTIGIHTIDTKNNSDTKELRCTTKKTGITGITGTISVLRSSARPACNPETDGELKNIYGCFFHSFCATDLTFGTKNNGKMKLSTLKTLIIASY